MHPVDQVGQPVWMKQTVDQKRKQPVTIGTILHHNKRTNQQQNQRRRGVPCPPDLNFAEWSKVIKPVKTKRKVREGKSGNAIDSSSLKVSLNLVSQL